MLHFCVIGWVSAYFRANVTNYKISGELDDSAIKFTHCKLKNIVIRVNKAGLDLPLLHICMTFCLPVNEYSTYSRAALSNIFPHMRCLIGGSAL